MYEMEKKIKQFFIKHKKQKRHAALAVLLSFAVAFSVYGSLITPAVSMTGDDEANAVGNAVASLDNTKTTRDVYLLAGSNTEGPIYAESLSEIINKADSKYALGIASQFCVFLNSDFKEWQADAEGRVAVGGDIYLKDEYGSYAIGKGDYNNHVNLDRLLRNEGYAYLVMGGSIKEGQLDDTYYDDSGNECNAGDSSSIGNSNRIVDINQDNYSGDPGISGVSGPSTWKKVDKSQTYAAKLFDFNEEFNKLNKNSQILASKANKIGIQITADNIDGDTVTFDANMNDKTSDVIYFNCTADVWNKIKNCKNYKFINIPKLKVPRTVVNSEDASDAIWEFADIVINIEPTLTDNFIINENNETGNGMILANDDVLTSINGVSVSNGLDEKKNNDIGVTSLLWNIYSEQPFNLKLGKNFQGTILAANADVTDGGVGITGSNTGTAGHLSGALIANSFNGGTEFGYRPYTGSISLLSLSSGYAIPVDKLIKNKNDYLSGASFSIKDSDSVIDSWISGNSTEYVSLPSEVDFSGDTDYSLASETGIYTKTYTITEDKAPDGYIKTSKNYNVTIKETINKNYLMPYNSGTIPQVIDVEITITDNSDNNVSQIISFQYRDSYETGDNRTQRKVVYNNTVFGLNITDQKVTQIGIIDNLTESGDVSQEAIETSAEIHSETSTEATETNIVSESISSTDQFTNTESSPALISDTVETADTTGSVDTNTTDTYNKIGKLDLQTLQIEGSVDINSSWSFTYNESAYYYDNRNMMIIPLPTSNLTFENSPGLLFKKVDDEENPVTGAAIELYIGDEKITETSIWNWDTSESSATIDLSKITDGTIYTFKEAVTPSGYEKAADIKFEKNGSQIIYWSADDKSDSKTLDDTNRYEISMIDYIKYGAVPSIKKVDFQKNVLSGANIALYAKNGTEICSWEDFSGDETSMKDTLLNVVNLPEYVKNGYLLPGVYYLSETKKPTDEYKNPGNMYFTVNNDFSITEGYIDSIPLTVSGKNTNEEWVKTLNGQNIANIVKIYFETTSTGGVTQIWELNNSPGDLGNSYTCKEVIVNNATMTDSSKGIKFANYSSNNVELTYVEITTSDGKKYVYESSVAPVSLSEESEAIRFDSFEDSDEDRPIFKTSDGNTISVRYIYVESNDETIDIWNTGTTWDEKRITTGIVNDLGEVSLSYIKLQTVNKWDSDFKITYFELIDADGKKYTYGTSSSGGSGFVPIINSDSTSTTNDFLEISDNLLTVTNVKEGEMKNVLVEKKWVGDEYFQSFRTEINVTLYRTTDTIDYKKPPDTEENKTANVVKDSSGNALTAVLDSKNNWTAEWINLESKDENGALYNYYVLESSVPTGYTASYSVSDIGKLIVTNTLNTKSLTISKEWLYETADITLPSSINIQLYWADSAEAAESDKHLVGEKDIYPDTDSSWSASWNGLAENKYYFVSETAINGWTVSYSENSFQLTEDKQITITNTLNTGSLSVRKIWEGENNDASSRPDNIIIDVYRSTTSLPVSTTTVTTAQSVSTRTETSAISVLERDAYNNYPFTIDSSSIGDEIYINVQLNDGITYANGCLGISAGYGEMYYWVKYNWSCSSSGLLTVPLTIETLNEITYSDGSNDVKVTDNTLIAEIIAESKKQSSGQIQIWWATDGNVNDVIIKNAYVVKTIYDNPETSSTITSIVTSDIIPIEVTPPVPGGGYYKQLTLNSANEWNASLSVLPQTDGQGNPYYYYIKEEDPGGSYIPVSYTVNDKNGNGAAFDGSLSTVNFTVTNYKTNTTHYTMPSTGGGGTLRYYSAGGTVVLVAAAAGGKRIRRRQKRRRVR